MPSNGVTTYGGLESLLPKSPVFSVSANLPITPIFKFSPKSNGNIFSFFMSTILSSETSLAKSICDSFNINS